MYLWSTTFEFFYRILTKLLDFYSFYSRELREGCKGAAGKSQLSFFSRLGRRLHSYRRPIASSRLSPRRLEGQVGMSSLRLPLIRRRAVESGEEEEEKEDDQEESLAQQKRCHADADEDSDNNEEEEEEEEEQA